MQAPESGELGLEGSYQGVNGTELFAVYHGH